MILRLARFNVSVNVSVNVRCRCKVETLVLRMIGKGHH